MLSFAWNILFFVIQRSALGIPGKGGLLEVLTILGHWVWGLNFDDSLCHGEGRLGDGPGVIGGSGYGATF